MATGAQDNRVPVWVQPADRELVQKLADLCASTTGAYGHPVLQVVESSPVAAEQLSGNTFIQEGTCWSLSYGAETVHMVDSIGMRCIAFLVDSPYEQFSAIELSMRAHNTETTLAPHLMRRPVEIVDQGTLSSVLDETRQLQADLDEARELGQEAREEEARARLDELVVRVGPSLGKAGRSRPFVDAVERARQSVHKNVGRALGAIRGQAPRLGAHLKQSISISRYCAYAPAQEANWTVKFSPPTRAL